MCENSWLKTLAKMLLFTGFALGSFCSGLVSDRCADIRISTHIYTYLHISTISTTYRWGRKVAIWSSSITMLVFGVITSFVPW